MKKFMIKTRVLLSEIQDHLLKKLITKNKPLVTMLGFHQAKNGVLSLSRHKKQFKQSKQNLHLAILLQNLLIIIQTLLLKI